MVKHISRRGFLASSALTLGALAVGGHGLPAAAGQASEVVFTRDISPAGLSNIHAKLMRGRRLPGRVAVKLHSGEPGGHHYPNPVLIKDLVRAVGGTIVECNTAYPGKRFKTADHKRVLVAHGFAAIAPVDIMDKHGSISLPCPGGGRLRETFVGAGFANYDSCLILSHFKGHVMGGFGGAIKNMSIGIASGEGKMWIHTAGATKSRDDFRVCFKTEQKAFLEAMVEAAGAIMQAMDGRLAYINLMNNLSVDCDCDKNPAPPELEDIGILASFDPVALDRACVDLIYAADKTKSAALRQRIESRHGAHTLDYAERLGLGSQTYVLTSVDG